MSYYETLRIEIDAKLDEWETAGKLLEAAWITHEICGEHKEGLADNDHAEFWEHGGHRTVRDEVRRRINDRRGDRPDRTKRDPELPGFQHLQAYYVVDRDGREVGVPILGQDAITDDEIDAKASLYDAMGDACHAHADELRRFKEERKAAA